MFLRVLQVTIFCLTAIIAAADFVDIGFFKDRNSSMLIQV